MVNCMCSDQFKIVFGLNYRKSGTGPSPSQKAAADPVLQLPVIPVRRGVIAEKALNRRHTLIIGKFDLMPLGSRVYDFIEVLPYMYLLNFSV